MFFNSPGKPTASKKTVYLFATTILGVLLSFTAHGFIEIKYLHSLADQGRIVVFHGGCALPPAVQIGFFIFGTVGGFFLGRFWWRKLYVERVWVKK